MTNKTHIKQKAATGTNRYGFYDQMNHIYDANQRLTVCNFRLIPIKTQCKKNAFQYKFLFGSNHQCCLQSGLISGGLFYEE
jgi:hypothetical protein